MGPMGKGEWFEEWFDRRYLKVYSHRDRAEAARDIDCIERLLPLARLQPILDLACGGGRHSLEMASRGYRVVGLDLSAALLEEAISQRRATSGSARFVRADKRRLPFAGVFGCVLNLFTSFGYFEAEEDNLDVMRGIRDALYPGGRFLIDYVNKDHVLSALVSVDYPDGRGAVKTQRRYFDPVSGRLIKTICIEEDGARRVYRESIRLYGSDELRAMAESAGLRVPAIHGALDGSPLGPDSRRAVLLGEKPDA